MPKAEAGERGATHCRTTFEHKAAKAKAIASMTNPGAVARGVQTCMTACQGYLCTTAKYGIILGDTLKTECV